MMQDLPDPSRGQVVVESEEAATLGSCRVRLEKDRVAWRWCLANPHPWSLQPPTQIPRMPPDLMSRNTLDNIASNKTRVDYCIDTFS
jgi:hypothetical protein